MEKTFGNSLVLRISGLILIALSVFAVGSYRLVVRPAIQGLAQAEMGLVSQQVDARVQNLLGSVEVTLRSSQGWGKEGALDHSQLLRFNAFFFPIIGHHPEISSVNFAHESGREILLLHTQEGKWVNRLSDPDRWGRKTYWLTWGADHHLEKVELRELDYDTRKRPWFRGAMALPSDEAVHWTDPYIFFTTKEPGITAAMRWRGRDGSSYVIGHDVKLLDLSRFTSSLRLGEQGQVALLKDDGSLIALPHDSTLNSDQALKAAVLKTAQVNGLTAVASGFEAWGQQGQPSATVMTYQHADRTWFGLFRPTPVGAQKVWLAVFAPEREFIPANASDAVLLGLIALGVLSLGVLVAVRIAQRMVSPLEALTRDSERIGRMDLQAPVSEMAQRASWHEVRQLAQTQESMRHKLLEGQTALAQANERLELKVAERTQAALQQTALITALLDVIPNAIFYKGADTRFLGCNQAYEAAFGVSREQFIGKRVLDLEYLPQDARQAFQAEDEMVIRTMGRVSRHESLVFADGKTHHALYSVTAFADAQGQPAGLIGVIVDVTELTQAEQAARDARAQAEAAASAKADFLANMSHEIRTPMNAVIGMTELALMTELTARQRGYLEKSHSAATNLLRLINDILDFSKIEAGKMSCEQAAFSLDTVMRQVADMATIRARDKDLELIFDIDLQVPDPLLGDALRLGQVLTNLVSNAVKFTEQGEVTVTVRCLPSEPNEALLSFEVRDTGIGMSQEEASRVFSAFAQADSSTTRRYGGTGLGLSICRRIVELMGGALEVNSQAGQGSCFFFTLRFAVPVAQTPPSFGMLQHQVRTMPVLVVDDNAAAREVLCHMLSALSFPVRAVSSGLQALAELDRADHAGQPYRVVLIDWKMPDMDGVETLRRVQALFNQPRPICLLATAHDLDTLTQVLEGTPVDGLLSKPVTTSSLWDAIVHAGSRAALATPERVRPLDHLPMDEMRRVLSHRAVLLVEDNVTNQEVAVALLQHVGIQVDVAADGAQALALAASKDYALVLMDCQMPVMDGYEATRRLRQDLGLTRLPVVAMTANVMPDEKAKCLAVGMNDYLDKPVDSQRFYATLLRWIAPGCLPQWEQLGGQNAPLLPGNMAPSDGLIDRAAALMRLGQDEALYEKLLQRFVAREADAAERLQAALAQGDAAEARRIVHNLKGLAGNMGADRLAQACHRLEMCLVTDTDERAAALLAWARQLRELLAHLSPSMTSTQADLPPQPGALDGQFLRAQLITLAEQLRDNDLQANQHAADLAHTMLGTAQAQTAQQVARLAAAYDYDQALLQLQTLAASLNIEL